MKKFTKVILFLIILLTLFGTIAVLAYDINPNSNINLLNLLNPIEKFKLEDLPYEANALEPTMDEYTLTLHHGKHEQAYIDALNIFLEKAPNLKDKSLEQMILNPKSIPKNLRKIIINNVSGIYNHEFFWKSINPNGGGKPFANIGDAIDKQYGSFENFKLEFEKIALETIGSGWIWLISDNKGNLIITSALNNTTPISVYETPIIVVDLWEHAYYLKYQNRKNEYLSGFWNIVNWDFAEKNYISGLKK